MCFFFFFFFGVFWCLEERKTCIETKQRAEIQKKKNVSPPKFEGCLGLFIASACTSRPLERS